ncbi:hypothetical protein BC939DRAFT_442221 [Gamsiella multidivaricata]|uniref:uncharacterized protein n=1 Tax=Gamsiella multidivaricata TaxID=101098 RepID=UPI00221ED60D|nr:uncharacterized protein BC939DRAFT_442221 [Gamsiella multidivaricata]KAG0369205.1 hypothetical protein BGZ54_000074 [Gamsiella multidivaricata]KAI7828898.1 hypothetical protein BC939DRAFT_442221 [Gamsiella multidivaricata]
MSSSQSAKEQQQAVKATIKAIEQDYKSKVHEAEKKCSTLRKEAEKVAEHEKAKIKDKKDKVDREAKDELQQIKHEAAEVHIKLVMDLVKNVILDIQSRNLELQGHYYQSPNHTMGGSGNGGDTINRSNSSSSAPSTTSTASSSVAKEDAEIKEWVEYTAERLETHMSKSQARQRLLEEIATGALMRQHQTQQEAARRTEDLQRQLQQLQLLQQQQQQQGQGQEVGGQDVPPPAYMAPVGIASADYSMLGPKKR